MSKYIYTVAIILLFSIQASAQKKWSLKECIDYAIENNIEVKQSDLSVRGAELDLQSTKDSRYPDLSASLGQNLNFGKNFTSSYDLVTQTSTNTSFSVNSSINLFDGLRVKHNIDSKKFSLLEAEENLNKVKDNLELQITAYYLDVLLSKEVVSVYKDQAQLNKEQVERTKVMVDAGSVSESQLFDIQAQYAQDLSNIISAENNFKLSLLNLAQTLNLAQVGDFEIIEPEAIVDVNKNIVNASDVYEESLKIKPHIKAAEYNLKSKESALKTAKSGYWPSINLRAGYSSGFLYLLDGSEKNKNNPVYEQWKERASQNVGLNINIPIFNRLQTKNQVKMARYNIESSKLQLDQVKQNLYKDIQQAHQRVGTSKAKFEASNVSLTATEKAFSFAKERYDVGRFTAFEYNEAQTKFVKSKSEQIQAKYDFLFQNKILDFYRGYSLDF